MMGWSILSVKVSNPVAVMTIIVLIAAVGVGLWIAARNDHRPPARTLSRQPGRSPDGRYFAHTTERDDGGVKEYIVDISTADGQNKTIVIDFSDAGHPNNSGYAGWQDTHTLRFTTCLNHGDYKVLVERWRDVDVTTGYMCAD